MIANQKNSPTECVLDALGLCLEGTNSVFNDKNIIQIDSTSQGAHMLCSYSDITKVHFDNEDEN